MKYIIDAKKYEEVSRTIYALIIAEIERTEDVELAYPKLVIMYEFFRLVRGEAFLELREPVSEYQSELYKMEEAIFSKLKTLKDKIPTNNSRAKYYFDNLISMGLKI